MFVFAFEGELLAFIVNGDRFVLLALLPRRKPRTDGTVQLPYHPYLIKELNLTISGYYPSLVLLGNGMDFGFSGQHLRCMEREEIPRCAIGFADDLTPCGRDTALTHGEPDLLGRGRADARDFVFGRSEDRRSSSSLRSSVYDSVMRQQVPKPRFEDASEGER